MRLGGVGWAALLALLGACSVPALDTTGRIRCGSAGECPASFGCVDGRCCPLDNGAPHCTGDGVDAGADAGSDAGADAARPTTCDDDAGQPCADGDECRANHCCPVGSGGECPAGALGSPCSAANECALTLGSVVACERNLDGMGGEEFPRGYCTGTCNPSATTNECGPLGVCVDLRSAGGTGGLCLRKCALGMTSCRGDGDPSGYTCFSANVPGLGPDEGVCYPDCARGASCVEGASCDNSRSECYYPCSAVSPTCPDGLVCDPTMHRCVSML